jgi:tetratricopeptide (TPR) repeat protein
MRESHGDRSRDEFRGVIAALECGHRDDAGVHAWRALQVLDHLQDVQERRNHLSEIAEQLLGAGFEDLALMALTDALAADRQLDDERSLTKDMMTYGNVQVRLGNLGEAEATYRSLIDDTLKKADYANAASASTNLAGLLADGGYLAEARQLLESSLHYLKEEAFPDTERNTLLTLIQVLDLAGAEPDAILSTARSLETHAGGLRPEVREVIARIVDGASDRRFAAHSQPEPQCWKQQQFPWLYRDG